MSGGRKPSAGDAEVDALLRGAEDAVLLKLSTNSHLVSSSSSSSSPSLDPELARRFDALKSRPARQPSAAAAGDDDDLEARFAALKGLSGPARETRVGLEDREEGHGGEEEEVEKVMRWAMDAARLDALKAGGGEKSTEKEEEEEEKSGDGSSEEEEEEELEMEKKKRKEKETGKKPKKWFFF